MNSRTYDFSRNQFQKDLPHFYFDIPKQEHWKILKTPQFMLDQGLVIELKKLLENGCTEENLTKCRTCLFVRNHQLGRPGEQII